MTHKGAASAWLGFDPARQYLNLGADDVGEVLLCRRGVPLPVVTGDRLIGARRVALKKRRPRASK